ncbi:MAG TPA: DUF1259 domain-containing protein [Longimicrobiales bacterium]|nr:DUF1259 domain-containing protein [Longimicrobiales bacterium]
MMTSAGLVRFAVGALLLAACTDASHNVESAGDAAAPAPHIDWSAVAAALGRPGVAQPGDVHRFGMPRSDLTVTSHGVSIQPALALGSWVAFKARAAGDAVMMGDLVLTEHELNPVLERLQQGGVSQTAIHKHLLDEEPAIWWTHVHGHGDPVQLAQTLRAALALTATPPGTPAATATPLELDTAQIRAIIGHSGRATGGVYNVSVPRAETIRAMGIEVPPSMGVSTVMNFQPTGGNRAAINGDFVMVAAEIPDVVQALRTNGINVVSLHNHLTDEEPRLFFMHFWAHDDAVALARGLRTALDRTNSRRAP